MRTAWLPIALALILGVAPSLAQVQVPPLVYDEVSDEECARQLRSPIQAAWIAELLSVLPQAQSLWHDTAPRMFEAASRIAKRPIAPPSKTIRLTLCAIPSQSYGGPVVNMRFALKSFTSEPVPLRVKVDTAFHESLHATLSTFDGARSKLLREHKYESACVLNHLHLLSLQKAVLLALGQEQELLQLIAIDSQLPSGCYRRAWSIINAGPETYLRYVRELSGEA